MHSWRRLGSFIIDISVIGMFSRVIYMFIGSFYILSGTRFVEDIVVVFLYLLTNIIIAVVYQLIFYKLFKQSFGRRVMNIKLEKVNGKHVDLNVLAKREICKYTYLYASLGLYGIYQYIINVCRCKPVFHDEITNIILFY